MHSIQSWKVSALVKAHTAVMDGKQPQNMYARDEKKQHTLSGWIICDRCKRAVCSGCASLILHNILNDKPIQSTIQKGETWCSLISEFLQISAPAGFLKAIKIPGHISHCCRLGCEVRRRRNQISRARKKTSAPGYTEMLPNQRNDGLLHYAPYRVVIAPSFRFFDTLCVAEQGYTNDVFHQEPVYHSVIPNDLAKQYDNDRIYPIGKHDDVVISDYYSYLSVTLPFLTEQPTMNFMVRRVLIRYSDDYVCHPMKGSCCLSNAPYFASCYRIFDERWEYDDIKSDVDVCLITGQPGPNDNGRNEILLSGRIYKSGFEIPICSNRLKNEFLQSCLSRILELTRRAMKHIVSEAVLEMKARLWINYTILKSIVDLVLM
jgi:hypothetical protein